MHEFLHLVLFTIPLVFCNLQVMEPCSVVHPCSLCLPKDRCFSASSTHLDHIVFIFRYPRSLEFLCKNSNNPKVTETNDHPLERLSRLISSSDKENSLSPIIPLVADQERFSSAVETVNPLTVIKSTGGKDKDCSENDKYIENVKVSHSF